MRGRERGSSIKTLILPPLSIHFPLQYILLQLVPEHIGLCLCTKTTQYDQIDDFQQILGFKFLHLIGHFTQKYSLIIFCPLRVHANKTFMHQKQPKDLVKVIIWIKWFNPKYLEETRFALFDEQINLYLFSNKHWSPYM